MNLTDNFIRACGARYIGHLVKVIQRATSNFGISLIKREESENKGRNFWLCQKMARLLIFTWDGFLFKPIDAAEITFVVLAEEYSFSCGSRKET